MKEAELKPCPFCHGMANVNERFREWDGQLYLATSVVCEVCGASTKEVWDINKSDRNERKTEVIDKWNRRV